MHTCVICTPNFGGKIVGKCQFSCIIRTCSLPPDTNLINYLHMAGYRYLCYETVLENYALFSLSVFFIFSVFLPVFIGHMLPEINLI